MTTRTTKRNMYSSGTSQKTRRAVATALLLTLWSGALATAQSVSETEYYDNGVGLMGQKKYGEAEVQFRKSIETDPRYKQAWQALANALRSEGKTTQATEVQKMADSALDARAGAAPPLTPEQKHVLDIAFSGGAGADNRSNNTAPAAPQRAATAAALAAPETRPNVGAVPAVAPAQRPRLTKSVARPGMVSGQAVYEDGRPIPTFKVEAAGFNGKFVVLGGPSVVLDGVGQNGAYAIRANGQAMFVPVTATTKINFGGKDWTVELWPTDNLHDGSGKGDFRGEAVPGVARDFILRKTGIKPGNDPSKYPGYTINDNPVVDVYYGGTLKLDCGYGKNGSTDWTSTGLSFVYPKGSLVTFTLVPTGALIDGTRGQTIQRSTLLGLSMYIYSLPIGTYTATAQLTEPSGAVHNLRLSREIPQTPDKWRASVPVDWEPSGTDDFRSRIVRDCHIYLVE